MPKINAALQQVNRILSPYQSIDKIRLHASERDTEFGDQIWTKFLKLLNDSDVRYYPNTSYAYEVLEQISGIKKEFLTLCDGSDTCLRNIFLTFSPAGSDVVTTAPAFPMYEIYAHMFGCNTVTVAYDDVRFPFERFIDSITNNTSIVILSNPSSPIGDILTVQQIEQLLARCKKHNALLVIDEAYIEFSNAVTSAHIAINNDNLIVVRTLSKAFGSAGVRIGYVVSTDTNKSLLYKVKANNEISSFAIKWLETLSTNLSDINAYISNVRINRDELVSTLQKKKIEVVPSQTNFIHVRYDKEHEYFVTRKCKLPWSDHYYHRVSIPGSVLNYETLKTNLLT